MRRKKMQLESAERDPWFGLGTFRRAIQYKHFAHKTYDIVKRSSDHRDADDETIIFERERAKDMTAGEMDAGIDLGFSLDSDSEGATSDTEDEILRVSSQISNNSSTGSVSPSEVFGPPLSDSLDSESGDSPRTALFCIV